MEPGRIVGGAYVFEEDEARHEGVVADDAAAVEWRAARRAEEGASQRILSGEAPRRNVEVPSKSPQLPAACPVDTGRIPWGSRPLLLRCCLNRPSPRRFANAPRPSGLPFGASRPGLGSNCFTTTIPVGDVSTTLAP